jgi:hypothetical protein
VAETGESEAAHGVHDRAGLWACLVSATILLGAVLLLGAGVAGSATSAATDTVRPLPITAAVRAELRASFYRVYHADPKEFSFPAGRPVTDFFVSSISDAAVVVGPIPAETSSWVIGGICIYGRVPPCGSDSSYKVFYRIGSTGPFVYSGGGQCVIPSVLAARWFPGAACDSLVRRGGLRGSGVWAALVPRTWILVPCRSTAALKVSQSLCSFGGGDTDIDIYFNAADTNELLEVTTCRGGDCFPAAAGGGPRLTVSAYEKRIAAWELSFHAPPRSRVAFADAVGSGAISGLFVAAHYGRTLSYPVFTVMVALPPSQTPLATAIVNSFVACLKPGVTISRAGCL